MIPNFSCFGDGDLISEDDHSAEDTFKDDDRSKNLIVEPCTVIVQSTVPHSSHKSDIKHCMIYLCTARTLQVYRNMNKGLASYAMQCTAHPESQYI